MSTEVTYFGQHFHFFINEQCKYGDNFYFGISNTDENQSYIASIDKYELKEVAEFILQYLENKYD